MAVLLFHTEIRYVPGGFYGVSIFFVLSGYLITTILVKELRRRESIDYRKFILKRLRRLVPSLVVGLVAASVAGLVTNVAISDMLKNDLSGIFYLQDVAINIPGWHANDIWGPLWSLAVEFQFYLLWPIFLAWASATGRLSSWSLFLAFVFFALLRPLTHVTLYGGGIYFLPFGHLDELTVGGMLAWLQLDPSAAYRRVATNRAVPIVTVAVIGGILLTADGSVNSYLDYGPGSLLAIVTALGIAHILNDTTSWLSRLLSLRPVWLVGAWSYAMYVFLNPVLVPLQHEGIGGVKLFALNTAVCVVFGAVVSTWWEPRFYQRRDRVRELPVSIPD